MDDQLKSNLTSKKHWSRLVYMVLFALFVYVAAFVVAVLIVVQFLFALVTGTDNRKLRQMGNGVAHYIHQSLLFLTYSSEVKPFPFSDWPEADPLGAEEPVVRSEHTVDTPEADVKARTPLQGEVEAPASVTPGVEVEAEVPPPQASTPDPDANPVGGASGERTQKPPTSDPATLDTPAAEEPRKD